MEKNLGNSRLDNPADADKQTSRPAAYCRRPADLAEMMTRRSQEATTAALHTIDTFSK